MENQIAIIANVGAATIAAILTGFLGFVGTWIVARREQHKSTPNIEAIAQVARADEDARRNAILSVIEQSISSTASKEFPEALDRLRAAIPLVVEKESPAVENLVSSYHQQALSQANAQFWFSVAAATVGFGWILYAGTGIEAANPVTAVKTLPGVVMDAVAFLFFKQASETRQRATELYDRLRRDRQSDGSVALVATIVDVKIRSAVQAQMALHMAGLQPTPIDLTKFLSKSDTSAFSEGPGLHNTPRSVQNS